MEPHACSSERARFGGFGASRGVGSFRQLQHMEFYRRSLLGRERVHSLSGLPSGLAALASSCVLNGFASVFVCRALLSRRLLLSTYLGVLLRLAD